MIYLAGDYRAIDTSNRVLDYLKQKGVDVANLGAAQNSEELKLQQIIPDLVKKVRKEPGSQGILICGTGVGVEIGANRFSGIRASLCRDAKQAEYARIYDNANVLCLGAWYDDDIEDILDAWFSHDFDGNEKRTQMMEEFDSWR